MNYPKVSEKSAGLERRKSDEQRRMVIPEGMESSTHVSAITALRSD
jgi:hypothetical protein